MIEKVIGKYFIFVDDDDKLYRNVIKIFVDNLDDDYDLLVVEVLYSYEYVKNLRIFVFEVFYFFNYDINFFIEYYYNNVLVCWGKLIKRDFYF